MKFTHPYSKYGLALVMLEEHVGLIDEITHEMLKKHLEVGLGHFRLRPKDMVLRNRNVKFGYVQINELSQKSKLIQSAGLADKSIYLSPNIISSDSTAKQAWGATAKLIDSLDKEAKLDGSTTITMSVAPVTSKINNGKTSQSNPRSSFLEACFCALTNTTPYKPCLTVDLTPTTIIPDLPLEDLMDFIELFKRMLNSRTADLLTTRLTKKKLEDGDTEKISRPPIFNGNYPYAPKSSAFGAVGLLASIGRWAEEAKVTSWALKVLDSLKSVSIYLVSYNGTKVVTYNHYIVELAKENQLDQIIRALEHTRLLGEERRSFDNPKYQQFSLFASRFLQLFNPPALKDFLAFRAEYEPELLILLQTYFGDAMNIPSEIVRSARALGKWLNNVAYFAAKNELGNPNDYEALKKAKAKALIELESAAFSAKTGTALISQVVTRAGRLTGTDAPEEATMFMEAVAEGRLNLDDAKNLLTAFSRVRGNNQNENKDNKDSE